MSELALSPTLKRILLEALILTMFAIAVGLSLNYQLVMNAFTGKIVTQPVSQPKPVEQPASELAVVQDFPDPIDLEEIDELLLEDALLVDARHIEDYKAGHLEGAVSLPLGEVGVKLTEFMAQVPKDQILILYCNGFGCPDSFDLGVILLQQGYQEVRAYEGGFPEWRDQGRPIVEGQQ